MSKGLGYLQNKVIEKLAAHTTPQLMNQIIWDLAQQEKKTTEVNSYPRGIIEGNILKSFSSSIRRSINILQDKGVVVVTKKKLQNVNEFLEWYPYKTDRREVLALRKLLLPDIVSFTTDKMFGPKFDETENELYRAKTIKEEKKRLFDWVTNQWGPLEKDILTFLPAITEKERYDLWMFILIRGRQLFTNNNYIKISFSFCRAIRAVSSRKKLLSKQELVALEKAGKIIKVAFPKKIMDHLIFKSHIYPSVSFASLGESMLSTDFKEYLYHRHTELIQSLPGHEEYPPSIKKYTSRRNVKRFSKLLDQLINRHAFAPFMFLTIP